MMTLASRLTPTMHKGEWGFWSRGATGEWKNLGDAKYGEQTGMDVFNSFIEGKAAPIAALVRDLWVGKDFSGQPVTPRSAISKSFTPFIGQNFTQFMKDPNTSSIIGSLILEGLGFSSNGGFIPNMTSKTFEEGKDVSNENLISFVKTYADALGSDPETAFNRIFTGQKITRVSNGAIIVERMPLKDSTAVKKKLGGNNPTMKLDHTIPLELGGSNEESNLKLVTTTQWSSYTAVENALGKALKSGKIKKEEAQKLIKDFKNGAIKKEDVLFRIK